MSIYLWQCYSAVQTVLRYFCYRALGLLSHVFPQFIGDYPSKCETPDDLEAISPVSVASKKSNCDRYMYIIWPQPQSDLETVGVGAAGQVYKVDNQVVLKTCRIFKQPGSDASDSDRWYYASDTLFHSNLLQNERTVLRVLQRRPHPHIVQAIDTDQPEGVYLRRYQPLSEDKIPDQLCRIRWYCDLTDALCYIHSLGIVHADIRIGNVLLDEQNRAVLCDFSAASPFGQPNLVFPDLPLPINGNMPVLSEATDMFAMGSLIFQMEHGIKPELSVDSHGNLVLPEIRTNHQGIDTIIRKAWLGHYSRTSEMLEHLNSLDADSDRGVRDIQMYLELAESLTDRVRKWRECRENKFGSVLNGILSEDQLQALADCYGLDKDADLLFTDYQMPL